MRTESMELAGTHSPLVSTGDLQEEDEYVNAAVDTVLNQPTTPAGPQKKDDRKSIIRFLSLVAFCWVILVIITGPRIHYTSVISAKLKDLEDIKQQLNVAKSPENLRREIMQLTADNRRLSEENHKLAAEVQKLREDTSTKAWRESRYEWTTTAMPDYYLNIPYPYYNRPRYYYPTPHPYYNTPSYYYIRPYPYYNRPSYYYTTPHPYTNKPRYYYPTPHPYYNRPSYYYTRPYPYYNSFQTRPSYFYGRKKRQTKACLQGWVHFQASCYMISSQNYQKTWNEAREDCRLRDADLVVVNSLEEQDFIYKISLTGKGASSFWIGLRVEGGGWRWVNESDLKHSYWLQPPAEELNCVTSVKEASGWKSVRCDDKNGWICQRKALYA